MNIRKYTVLLSFPAAPKVTGVALVHATNTLGAEAYAVGLFPEPVCGRIQIVAIFTGWHYPERSEHSPGLAIRAYPVPLSGSHPAIEKELATC